MSLPHNLTVTLGADDMALLTHYTDALNRWHKDVGIDEVIGPEKLLVDTAMAAIRQEMQDARKAGWPI